MELKNLKPILGRWLTIDELRGFLTETPEEVIEQLPINRKLLETASEFVEERQGRWEHPDWEGFLARLSSDGFRLSKELEPPIGNILEIFKAYYRRDGFETIAEKRRKPAVEKNTRAKKTATAPGKKRTIKQA